MTKGNVDVAEWLRRRPAKPLGFARVSSNLIVDDTSFFSEHTFYQSKNNVVYLL